MKNGLVPVSAIASLATMSYELLIQVKGRWNGVISILLHPTK